MDAIAAASWTETGSMRVRMTIHPGEAMLVGIDDVAAPCINRLARLISAVYRTVVLPGDIARRRVESHLSDGVTLCISG